VVEAQNRPGGRLGSIRHDGHILDLGFQVLFTHFPALHRLLDLEALQLHRIDSGAILRLDDRFLDFENPLMSHKPMDLFRSIQAPFMTWTDKIQIGKMTLELMSKPADQILKSKPLGTVREYLAAQGFSGKFVQQFVRPFFGGIFLSQDLQADARLFRLYWKMLITGGVALPEGGMQAVPDQLADRLGRDRLRLGAPVAALKREGGGRATGVRLASGETLEADVVVLALDYPSLVKLVDLPGSFEGNATTNLYFESPKPLITSRKVLLNGSGEGWIDLVCQTSNIAPSYAPEGKHQIAIQLLENPDLEDEALCRHVQDEVHAWVPSHDVRAWKPLEVMRIPFGQFRQEPSVMDALPGPRLGEGLYLASELTTASNYDGAVRGGERAARAIREDEGTLRRSIDRERQMS
ncbi:MAG: NAD(P)/FAD-dependent oxidoreductase, partial [Candidatus Sericytochromatia bacterium]